MQRFETTNRRCWVVTGILTVSIPMVLAPWSAALAQRPNMQMQPQMLGGQVPDLDPIPLPELPELAPWKSQRIMPLNPFWLYGACSARFSPDGRFLVVPWLDIVLVWDVATRREVTRLTGHRGFVTHGAFSSDGKKYASGTTTETRIWNVSENWKLLREIKVEYAYVTPKEDAPKSPRVVSHYCEIFNSRRTAMAFSPDAKRLARVQLRPVEKSYGVGIYDVTTGDLLGGVDDRPSRHPVHVSFSGDGRLLKVGGFTGNRNPQLWPYLIVYDASTLKQHKTRKYSHTLSPRRPQFVFSRDGSLLMEWRIIPGLKLQEFNALDSATWRKSTLLRGPWLDRYPYYGCGLAELSVDNRTVALSIDALRNAGARSDVVWLSDVATGRTRARLRHPSTTDLCSPICFSEDGNYLVTMAWEILEPAPMKWPLPTFLLWDLRPIGGSAGVPNKK